MPELPEVETVMRGLQPVMAGARITRLKQNRANLRFPFPDQFATRVKDRRITRLARRAKYLLAHLDNDETLVMHLGMSGRFTISPNRNGKNASTLAAFTYDTGADPKHDHIVFALDNGAAVTYNDPRRFGFMLLIDEATRESHKLFAGLGPEPLGNEFNAAHLASTGHGKRCDLKAFLMDQRIVAGLGNIYVCEALHYAGLSPNRMASCLATAKGKPTVRAERLAPAIRKVLTDAIHAGGSTLRDYRHADGALGYFQHSFSVYGRADEACIQPGCQGIVRRKISAGRSTFYCAACQR